MNYDQFMTALCIWKEARGESYLGKLLVAETILNRADDPQRRWPEFPAEVVLQPKQFSAFNPGDPNAHLFPEPNDRAWKECCNAACAVIGDPITESPAALTGVNHYHAKSVDPDWADPSKVVAVVGNHIFYEL